ncbi:hypothetical protein [Conexibacter sp. CPCC 206217]|uniref:hypothetical protein n=1 Tax=Conexibacter sp. CPCC 206217 TaxID=3064574 RepID=UPI00271EE3F4|nr:hypothetical protein [Conexibacter sp. CPCC 206217]MDO8214060.1 hypothetical protein [Conexibacter sp. CPCC 206217]
MSAASDGAGARLGNASGHGFVTTSGAVSGFGGLFGDAVSATRTVRRSGALPNVAVLCTTPRGAAVTAAIALALARACGRPFALAAAVGVGVAPAGAGSLVPSAARAAAQLRRGGHQAQARGRLVWLADRRVQPTSTEAGRSQLAVGPADAAAALSADLTRAAAAVAAPCALAIPFARSQALDRVLGWHDTVVVVRAPDASAALLQLVLTSVAALDRPVVAVQAPGRFEAGVAMAGLHAPAFARRAVAQLGIGKAPW